MLFPFPPRVPAYHGRPYAPPAVAPTSFPGLLSDVGISQAIKDGSLIIRDFVDKQTSEGKLSFGLSSFGYDLRVARKFKVFTNAHCAVVDPKNFDEKSFVDVEADYCLIPPNSFALAQAVEWIKMPRDLLGMCCCKSTYARCGVVIPTTIIEPEWEGILTIEISNTTPLPAKIYANEGICQLLFFRTAYPVSESYADRSGRYQSQTGLTLPNVRKPTKEID